MKMKQMCSVVAIIRFDLTGGINGLNSQQRYISQWLTVFSLNRDALRL
jgi:hypothetical protein